MPCSRCSNVPTQLQPPPEMAAAPPRYASFSRMMTWAPASCTSRPAATPTAPEPTIKTSVRLDLRAGVCITSSSRKATCGRVTVGFWGTRLARAYVTLSQHPLGEPCLGGHALSRHEHVDGDVCTHRVSGKQGHLNPRPRCLLYYWKSASESTYGYGNCADARHSGQTRSAGSHTGATGLYRSRQAHGAR